MNKYVNECKSKLRDAAVHHGRDGLYCAADVMQREQLDLPTETGIPQREAHLVMATCEEIKKLLRAQDALRNVIDVPAMRAERARAARMLQTLVHAVQDTLADTL